MKIFEKTKNLIYSLLKKSERYTQTDMIYLAKGGFWLILRQIISTAASLLLAITFANLLSPTMYGNYKYIISLTAILSISSLVGMRTAITQAVARGLEGSFYTVSKIKLKWSSLGSLIAIILAGYYYIHGNYLLPIPLLILAVFSPFIWAPSVYSDFLAGRKAFNTVAKYGIITRLVFVGTMIITLLLTKSLSWLIASYFISQALITCFFYVITKLRFKPNKKESKKTISYGKHLSLMTLISGTANHLDKILIFTLIGAKELAVYSFAMLIPEQIISIFKNINALALPKLSTKSNKEIKTTLMKKFWNLFLLVGIAILIYISFAPYIYKLFFPQYTASIPYSQLLIFLLIGLPALLITTSFQAKMMTKKLYLFQTGNIIRIIFLIILTPIYGIWGVVFSVISSKAFNLVVALFLFKKL